MRHPTVEWQVCGVCNYDCSYCIQSRKYRVGHPSREEVERFLDFFAELPGRWEIKMTGGEPFAFKDYLGRILPQLVERTPHTLSTLTNLSAPLRQLRRFAELTRGRLGIVSASLHLEFTPLEEFLEKAVALRQWMDPPGAAGHQQRAGSRAPERAASGQAATGRSRTEAVSPVAQGEK